MATKIERLFKRFETEEAAKDWAYRKSVATGDYMHVLESPPRNEDTNEPIEGGRYVADSDGMVRNWERLVATYHAGQYV